MYKTIDTVDVCQNVEKVLTTLGFNYDIKYQKIKGKNTRHRMIYSLDISVKDSRVQLIVENSYDGESSLVFRLGLFRPVCSNGLVVSIGDAAVLKVRHIEGSLADSKLRDLPLWLCEQIPRLKSDLNTFNNYCDVKQVSDRFLEHKFKTRPKILKLLNNIDIKPYDINDGTLWGAFNASQERLTRISKIDSAVFIKRNDNLMADFINFVKAA